MRQHRRGGQEFCQPARAVACAPGAIGGVVFHRYPLFDHEKMRRILAVDQHVDPEAAVKGARIPGTGEAPRTSPGAQNEAAAVRRIANHPMRNGGHRRWLRRTSMNYGPVDWIVVEFPGPDFGRGQIAPFLEDLVNRDLVRVLDMAFLRKTEDGTLETAEILLTSTPASSARCARPRPTWPWCSLSRTSLTWPRRSTPATPPRCSSGRTCGRPRSARQSARPAGQLVASGRIPTQAVIAAFQADAEAEEAIEGA